jgi:hypothetical protein
MRANGPSHIDPNTDEMEKSMWKLALILLTVSLMSIPASAQSSIKPKCPAGYDLVGTYCQNNSTGDIVLPN